jgi:hypothetical protein
MASGGSFRRRLPAYRHAVRPPDRYSVAPSPMQFGPRSLGEFRARRSRGAGLMHASGRPSRHSGMLGSRTWLSPPISAKSGDWFSALFVGYEESRYLSDDDQWPLCANTGHSPRVWRACQGAGPILCQGTRAYLGNAETFPTCRLSACFLSAPIDERSRRGVIADEREAEGA